MGFIYKITNEMTKKRYIGQTKFTIDDRFNRHLYNARKNSNSYFYNAIKKYGNENFIVELIEEVDDSLLNEREIYWIKELNTLYPNGYNETIGGTGGDNSSHPNWIEGMKRRRSYKGVENPMYGKRGELSPIFGKKHSKEVKKKQREARNRYWSNLENRKRQSERYLGENNPMKGKTPPNARPITFGGVLYPSIAAASRATGHTGTYLIRNCDE